MGAESNAVDAGSEARHAGLGALEREKLLSDEEREQLRVQGHGEQ